MSSAASEATAQVTGTATTGSVVTTTNAAGATVTSTSLSTGGVGSAYQTGALGVVGLVGGALAFAANL